MRRAVGLVASLIGLGAVMYGRALSAPFVFDDVLFTAAPETRAATLLDALAVMARPIPRPLTRASFAVNFVLGGLAPFGYHLVNLALHVLAGCLLYVLLESMLRQLAADHPWHTRRSWMAFVGAVIWFVHPVQSQAVLYVWQRSTVLCACFYLLALITYMAGRRAVGARRVVLFVAASLAGIAALWTKENAGSLPGAIALIELTLFQPAAAGADRRSARRRYAAVIAAASAVLLLVAANYLGPRFVAMMAGDFARRGFSLSERLLTECRVVLYYVGLLILPHPSRLTLDYDIVVSKSIFDPPATIVAVLAVMSLVGYGVVSLRRRPLIALPLLWYFGLLVIESTAVPLDLAWEHRLYLPSMLPIGFAAAGMTQVACRQRFAATAIASVAATILATWSCQRAEVWREPVRLWSDTAQKSPRKARVHGNLARALVDAGRPAEALREYERTHDLVPTMAWPIDGQATVLLDFYNDTRRARPLVEEALVSSPGYLPALNNRGVIEMREGDFAAARATFAEVLQRDPGQPQAEYNLAAVAFNAGDRVAAEAGLRRALLRDPSNARTHALLAVVYASAGSFEQAHVSLAAARECSPRDPAVMAAMQEVQRWRAERAAALAPQSAVHR